jgi:thioredoxin-related protein
MQKINSLILRIILASLLCICSYSATAYSAAPNDKTSNLDFFHTFSGSIPTELALAKKENKFGALLFFSTSHCPFCIRMKKTVFNQIDVRTYFQSNFRLLEIDIESNQLLTDEQNQQVNYMDYAKLNRVRLTPTIAFLDQSGDLIYRQVGMIVDPQEFIWLAEYVMSGQTRKQNFATFKMNKRKSNSQ